MKKMLVVSSLLLSMALPGQMAHAIYQGTSQANFMQSELRGKYVNGGNYWIFYGSSGEFWQTKSINGQPGQIVIYFDYTVDGTTLRYTQKKIELVKHPNARSQTLNKLSTEQIKIGPDYIVIGGKTYRK